MNLSEYRLQDLPADDYKTQLARQAAVADALNTAAQRRVKFS